MPRRREETNLVGTPGIEKRKHNIIFKTPFSTKNQSKPSFRFPVSLSIPGLPAKLQLYNLFAELPVSI